VIGCDNVATAAAVIPVPIHVFPAHRNNASSSDESSNNSMTVKGSRATSFVVCCQVLCSPLYLDSVVPPYRTISTECTALKERDLKKRSAHAVLLHATTLVTASVLWPRIL
jgi:hypothetical protein